MKTTMKNSMKVAMMGCAILAVCGVDAGELRAPRGVVAEAIDHESVLVRWEDRSVGETGQRVRTRTDDGGATKVVRRNREMTVVSGLQPSTDYTFQVRAFDGASQSPWSAPATATTLPPPDTEPPTIVFADPLDGAVIWGAGVVEVVANDNGGSGVGKVELFADGVLWGESTVLPFEIPFDTGTLADGPHVLTVKATDKAGNFAVASINVIIENVMNPPGGLTAAALSESAIRLDWIDTSNVEHGVEVQRSDDGGENFRSVVTLPANTVTFTDVGLTPNTTYTYRIRFCRGCAPALDL
jgi:chitodextrinase